MTTENLDKHLINVQNEMVTTVKKIVEVENIPVKELRAMGKLHSENLATFNWLLQLKEQIEKSKQPSKIVSL
jgi:hypothetical protein